MALPTEIIRNALIFIHLKKIQIQFAILAALLAYGLSISSITAQTYVIKGELSGTYFSWTGQQVDTQITKFTINIEGNRWLLKSEYTTNWFWLVGGDGVNTYSVLVDPKAPHIAAPATVFLGDFPQAALDTVSIPWLSFCSSDFLSHSTEKEAISSLWSQAQTDPMSHICSTEITQFSEPPYLPKEIKWITSTNQIASASSNSLLRIEGATTQELDRRTIDFQASFLPGKLLGNYRVLDTTNMNGSIIPIKFELSAYGYFSPPAKEHAQRILNELSITNDLKEKIVKDTYLVAVYKGTVAEISVDSNHVELPEPNLPMSVTDYRLSSRSDGIDYISYMSAQWKPEVDSELLNLLEIKKKHPPHNLSVSNPITLGAQKAVRVLILFVFFVPILVWGARILKNRKSTKTKKGPL
jgi:hypothetical protein